MPPTELALRLAQIPLILLPLNVLFTVSRGAGYPRCLYWQKLTDSQHLAFLAGLPTPSFCHFAPERSAPRQLELPLWTTKRR